MLGGSIWMYMKSNLCWNPHTNSNHAPNTYQTWKVLYAKQPVPLRTKNPVEINYNSTSMSTLSTLSFVMLAPQVVEVFEDLTSS